VTVIDGTSNTPTTVEAGTAPSAVVVNPVTNKIYVANLNSNNVTVIDGASNTTTTVEVGSYPLAIAVNPVTNKIYVANNGSKNVSVIDGAGRTAPPGGLAIGGAVRPAPS
ncbi:YVTN family beta-propeller repeat-containing protein, partial [Mesorhizobium sp. M00.F.Ca.ET.186.01.1.1]